MSDISYPTIPEKIVTTVTIKQNQTTEEFDLHWQYGGLSADKHTILLHHTSCPQLPVVLVERDTLHDTLLTFHKTLRQKHLCPQCLESEFIAKVLTSMPAEYLDLIRNQ